MYITLSSKNEASNSRFINKFGDTLTLPPGSSVALASITLNQESNDNRITVPQGQYIYLRFDGQNIMRVQPNPAQAVTYSKQEFVDKMNTLIPAVKPYGSNVLFQLDGNDDIEILFYTEPAYDYPVDFGTYIWGSNLRPQSYYGVRDPITPINFQEFNDIMTTNGTSSLSAPIQFNINMSFGLPAYTSVDAPAGKSIYIDTPGISRAFNRAKVFDHHDDLENTIYDSFGICWAPQNAAAPYEDNRNRWIINWGISQYDRSVNKYVKIPAYVANIEADFKENLLLKGDYTYALNIWNNDNNDFDINTGNYLPGDVWQHFLQLPTLPNQTLPNDARLYVPMYRQLSYNGLLYSYHGCLRQIQESDRQYNSGRIAHEPASGLLQAQADTPMTDDFWLQRMGFTLDSNTVQPCGKAFGVHSGYGQDTTFQDMNNVTPFFIGGQNVAVTKLVGQAEPYFNNIIFLHRRAAASGLGNVQDLMERVSLTRGKLTSLESAAFSIYTVIGNDTAHNNAADVNEMTLLGGKRDDDSEGFLLKLHLNQSEAFDVSIGSKDQTQAAVTLAPQDGGGNRINIQNGDRIGIVCTYTRGDTKLKIAIWQIDATFSTAFPFYAETTVATGTFIGLNNAQTIGPNESDGFNGTNAGAGFTGGVAHFRWYGFPAATTEASLPAADNGDDFYEALGKQWINLFDNSLVTYAPNILTPFNSTDPKYAVTGNRFQNNATEDEVNNYCPVFVNEVGLASPNRLVNNLYPDLVDVYCVPNVMLPFANNYEGVENLPAATYTGNGGGITNNDLYESFLDIENEDAANRREIAPYTWYDPGDDNPWNEITAEGVPTTELNQAVRVHIENLPHRTYNGTTGNLSKAIYEIQSDSDKKDVIQNTRTMALSVPEKIRIPLNNPGNIVLNEFDVLITDQEDKELDNIKNHTSLTLEIL